MNGTLLDLFGVIAASTGLLGAAVSGALAFLFHRAAGSEHLRFYRPARGASFARPPVR